MSSRKPIEIRRNDGKVFSVIDCAYIREETQQDIKGFCVHGKCIGQESTSYMPTSLFIPETDIAKVKYSA